VGIALVLFGIERLIGWPDWLTVKFTSRRHRVLTQPLALTLRRLPCLLHFRKIVTRVIGTAG
jgi:hypothetical protein